MVGIPSSRGCETCRQRKIKCDESRPACLKCTNRHLICPGYPARLKFMDDGLKFRGKSPIAQPQQTIPLLQVVPTSAHHQLSLELCQTFRQGLPKNLSLSSFSRPAFVMDLPRHVGLSSASDLAMKAVCLAHNTLLNTNEKSLVQSRVQYVRAIAELQRCVADPEQAATTGTLCATMLLGIFEQLLWHDSGSSIQHAGGAARLIEAAGPCHFNDPFAFGILTALQGRIVIESILCRRRCFLDTPQWHGIIQSTRTPFSALFSILCRLPNVLFDLRSHEDFVIKDDLTLAGRTMLICRDLREWRNAPGYSALFKTTSRLSSDFGHQDLIYESERAASILCIYAAAMILTNSTLLLVSNVEKIPCCLENLILSRQICQSYEYSKDHSPVSNLAMDFALRVAYLVPDIEQKGWITEKLNEMVSSLGQPQERYIEATSLEECFSYLYYGNI